MRSRTKSIYGIMVLALFLGSVVFTASARAELAEAKAKLKSDLANINEKAKEQAKAGAEQAAKIEKDYKTNKAKIETEYKAAMKKIERRRKDAGVDGVGALFADKKKAAIIKSINKEEVRIKAEYEEAKAKVAANYKRAKAELDAKAKIETKEVRDERVKVEKDYKQKVAEINSRAKAQKAAAKAKAKAEVAAKKRAEAEKKKEVKAEREKAKAEAKAKAEEEKRAKAEAEAKAKAEAAAKKKAEAEKKRREKAEREKARAEAKAELAAAEAKIKSDLVGVDKKAKEQAKARAKERRRVEKDYKNTIAKIESDYKAANKKIEKRAKDAGVDGLGALFADKKKAAILKSINKDKARIKAEYENAKAKAKAQCSRSIAALEAQAKSQAKEIAQEKITITKEYKERKSEIDLKLNAEKIAAKAKAEEGKRAKAEARAKAKAEAAARKKAEVERKKKIKAAREKTETERKEALAKAEREKKLKQSHLEAKAKADTIGIAEESTKIEKEYKSAKAKVESQYEEARKKAKAEAKVELAEAQTKMKSDSATVDKKAKAQAKARAQEKVKIEQKYKNSITKAESKYKEAEKRLEKRRREAGVAGIAALFADKKKAAILKSIAEEEARIKAECKEAKEKAESERKQAIVKLEAQSKAQKKETAQEKTGIIKEYEKAKSAIDLKSKLDKVVMEYKQTKSKAEGDYKQAKLDLEAKKPLLTKERSEEKARVEAEYKEALAKIDLKSRYAKAKVRYAHLAPPEDISPRFLVKEIKISGNTLVSMAELLENLPVVYTISVRKDETTTEEFYDFRVLHEIILDPGQEREVSKKTIQGLTRYLLSVYQEKGYAGIYVYVPAKAVKGVTEIEDGILPIGVLEGKVAKVTIDRYDFDRQKAEKGVLKSSVLKSWSPIKRGQVIKKKELDDFVRLLNLNPDRYISAVISRGDKPDTLNLGYDVYEVNPWHWFVQLDNAGTDERQWNPRVGVVNTNLTGRDDRFSFMYQAPPDGLEENYLLFGNYEAPFLTPRLRLGFYAGYSQFEITPEAGGGIVNFRGNGSFYGGTLRYNVLQINEWFFDFLGSLSHERSKVTPSLGIATDIDMDLFGVGGEIHRSDNMSRTSVSFNRIESFGGSSEDDFTMARLNADPDFAIYTLSASHKQFLDKSKIHELSGSFRSITSDHRLVPAKMTTFGGLYSVRGYEEDEIVADGGILASLQYRFDVTKYLEEDASGDKEKQPTYKKKAWPPNVSLLGFIDHGRAKMKDPVPGEERAQELFGAGLGTAVELGNSAYGAIYYSWPLRATNDTEEGEGRWNFNFIYRW